MDILFCELTKTVFLVICFHSEEIQICSGGLSISVPNSGCDVDGLFGLA